MLCVDSAWIDLTLNLFQHLNQKTLSYTNKCLVSFEQSLFFRLVQNVVGETDN